jgi:hypothetical protein
VQEKLRVVYNTTPNDHTWVQLLEDRQQQMVYGDLSCFRAVLGVYMRHDHLYMDFAYFTAMRWPTIHLAQRKPEEEVMAHVNRDLRHMFVTSPTMAWRAGESCREPSEQCPCHDSTAAAAALNAALHAEG